MRKRVAWIAVACLLVLWVASVFIRTVPGRVTLSVLGETNIDGNLYRLILISNGSHRTHTCLAWAESERPVSFGRTIDHRPFIVPPGEWKTVPLPIATNGPVTVTMFDSAIAEPWEQRLRALTALVGIRPPHPYKMQAKSD